MKKFVTLLSVSSLFLFACGTEGQPPSEIETETEEIEDLETNEEHQENE